MQSSSRHALTERDRSFLEDLLLRLGNMCEIRIQMNSDTAATSLGFALVGGLLGAFLGGGRGAMLGAGVGGVTGMGVATVVALSEIWEKIKETLQGVFNIMYDYLRSLEPRDYIQGAAYIFEHATDRAAFVKMIIRFIGTTLNTDVFSNVGDFLIRNQRSLQ